MFVGALCEDIVYVGALCEDIVSMGALCEDMVCVGGLCKDIVCESDLCEDIDLCVGALCGACEAVISVSAPSSAGPRFSFRAALSPAGPSRTPFAHTFVAKPGVAA